MNSPCKECKDRERACHDTRTKYAEWLDKLRTVRAKERQSKITGMVINDKIGNLRYNKYREV